MAPSSRPLFVKDELVFCYHRELLYEAKVLDTRPSDPTDKNGNSQYLVHYKGWKKSHDEWVSQDRLRKSNDESRELADNLKKEHSDHDAAPKTTKAASKKRAASSEDSALGSPSRETSPGLPGFSKLVRRNNSRDNRSPLHFQWGSLEPPAKRLRLSPGCGDGKPTAELLPSIPTSLTPLEASSSKRFATHLTLLDDLQSSSSGLSPAPSSSPSVRLESGEEEPEDEEGLEENEPEEKQPERPSLRRGRTTETKNSRAYHEIFGNAELGSEFRSRNDPRGVHGPDTDYPCGKLDNLMHHHLEYPLPEANPYAEIHKAIKDDSRAGAAKRLFFEGQDPSAVLMVAGVSLEGRDAMFPKASDSKTTGRIARGRKSTAPKNRTSLKKGSFDDSAEQEKAFHSRPSHLTLVPDRLKSILVDDWENVTKNFSLVPLPSTHPVAEILDEYFDEERGKRLQGSTEADFLEELTSGFKGYFEECLGRKLLYRFERDQLFRIRKLWEGKGPADVYGAEHLSRMLVSMPSLAAETNLDEHSTDQLLTEVGKMAHWLARNSARFFTREYEPASAEYIQKARGDGT